MDQLAGFDFALVYWVARMVASFFAYSFAGWLFEVIISLFQHHRFVDRGFSFGPVCPIYGVGALLAVLFLSHLTDPLVQFVVGFFAAGVLEFSTSWVMERMFHARWWDYSNIPLNINGRICLLYSIFWGILGVLWIKDLYPRMSKWILKIPNHAGKIVTWVLTVFMAVNCLVSAVAVWRWAERVSGVPAANDFEELLDARFPDERMERIYANMSFD